MQCFPELLYFTSAENQKPVYPLSHMYFLIAAQVAYITQPMLFK